MPTHTCRVSHPTSLHTAHPYLDDGRRGGAVIAMAHRGGAGHPDLLGAENTLFAFRHAVSLGYRYLETDVHTTSDGVLVAFHDDVLDRVTDARGPLRDLTAERVSLARIREEHPVPLVADLLEELPDVRFNIDLKSAESVEPLARLLRRTGSESRVCVGSFSQRRLDAFRHAAGGRVATSASPQEVAAFVAAPSGRLARLLTRGRVAALQVPHRRGPVPVVTRELVRRAHAARAHVHVWTVDDPAEMEELIDLGVDGLITDRTDVLRDVLVRRGAWEDPA
ncbi:MAG: Glycerophosphoryl diester phosphodiesterase [Marmoricola sp.]|nr:Glycerophosphoryl diester phosphodiesterase [Marmoricola sp.]